MRSLTNRVLRICSPSVIDEEFKTLRTILSKNGYPGYILAKLVARDPPGRRIGARFCPLVLQVPWLGKRTDELVRKANNTIRLAYFTGAVRPVYRTTRAFSLPKNRLPTLSQEQFNLPLRVPQLWEAVRRKDGTTASWPDWSTRSEAHHYGTGTREENTWSTTEGEKQPSGGVRLCDCLSSGCKQDMQTALRGWWLFGADEGGDKESPKS